MKINRKFSKLWNKLFSRGFTVQWWQRGDVEPGFNLLPRIYVDGVPIVKKKRWQHFCLVWGRADAAVSATEIEGVAVYVHKGEEE